MMLLDSSLLVAYKIRNDINHGKANALMKQVVSERFGKPMISDYIFDETVTGIFVRSRSLALAAEYASELLASPEMLKVDERAFREAWDIFSRQEKRELSFTDSIALMKIHDIGNVGTFDGDFKAIKGIDAVG